MSNLAGLQGRARQMQVQVVVADILLLSWKKSDPEAGVIARQERNAVLGVGHLPAQDARPETREAERVVRVEAEREEVTRHSALPSDLLTQSRRYGPSSRPQRNN